MHAAMIREHLRIPGMGTTTARLFRDKLAMRVKAFEAGIRVPDFVHVLNYDEIRGYMETRARRHGCSSRGRTSRRSASRSCTTPSWSGGRSTPWTRGPSSRSGPRTTCSSASCPATSSTSTRSSRTARSIFTGVNRYWRPPMEVAHKGGVFLTNTVRRGSRRGTAAARHEPRAARRRSGSCAAPPTRSSSAARMASSTSSRWPDASAAPSSRIRSRPRRA